MTTTEKQYYLLSGDIVTASANRDDGYVVNYTNPDMKRLFEKHEFEESAISLGDLSHLGCWQQRVIAEKAQLKDRLTKLSAFVEGEAFQNLSLLDQNLLREQKQLMERLDRVLWERIARFGVDDEPAEEEDQPEHQCCGKCDEHEHPKL